MCRDLAEDLMARAVKNDGASVLFREPPAQPKLGDMLVPRKDVEKDEHAIERRLVGMVYAGTQLNDVARTARKGSAKGTGLFLVKSGTTAGTLKSTPSLNKATQPRAAKMPATSEAQGQARKTMGRILPMRSEKKELRLKTLLTAMAGLATLLRFGHTVLAWLRIV